MARLHARIGTLRQLEILLAVHSSGSITQASKQLHLTQPTISVQLKRLADAVGVPLYDQIGRRIVFTEAGTELVKSAHEVFDSFDRLEMKLADLQGLKAGTLRLSVVTTAKYFIPHFLGEFIKRYPNIDVRLSVGNRAQTIARLDAGEDDFYVFSHPPENYALELVDFFGNPLVPLASDQHPLAREKQIPFEQFAQQPFLMREEGSGTRYAIERQVEKLGIPLNIRFTIESNEAIRHSVISELGVTILSRHILAFGGDTGLTELDVQGLPIETHWYLARPAAKKLSVVGSAFLDFVNNQDKAALLSHGREPGL